MKKARALWFKHLLFYIQRILLVNLVFVFIGLLWRVAFLWVFGNAEELRPLKSALFEAFVLGARFDATVMFYVNAIPLLILFLAGTLSCLPFLKNLLDRLFSHFNKFLVPYMVVMLSLVNFFSAIDMGFYGFYQDRINVLIFGFFEDDTWALAKTIWRNYPVIWILLGLWTFTGALIWGLKKAFPPLAQREFSNERPNELSYPLLVAFLFSVFFLNGVGARGTLALFPLSEMDTGISKSIFINHLCFNGTRALTRAIELKAKQRSSWDSNLKYYGYADNPRRAFSDYFDLPESTLPADPLELLKTTTPKNPWIEANPPHVVVIVMESLGGYWLRYQDPNFDLVGGMKSHFAEDVYLKNFLSSSAATIGSLSSLMVGTPQRPIGEFLTESEYLQVPFRTSIAKNFKSAGYDARFIYGGNPGWREINKFAKMQGFDSIEGEAEISEGLGVVKEKHDWGIYDEDVFEYLWQSLEKASRPQLVVTMTTTNHPPYQLPASYAAPKLDPPAELRARITDQELAEKRFKTYRYSTDKLSAFLDRLKKSKLKDKVIVAVTGDHTFWIVNFTEQDLLHKGSVPFYLYTPQALRRNINADTFGSQMDIPPTLYNLALSQKEVFALGQDLFDTRKPAFAINASNLVTGMNGGVLTGGSSSEDHYFDWAGSFDTLVPGEATPEKQEMAKKYKSLMSILDYYFMKEKNENTRR